MDIKIIQITALENKICGLGEDNKIYRWDYPTGTWLANWNTRPDETIEPVVG